MTAAEQRVYDAAKRYVQFCTPLNYDKLVSAVFDVQKPEHLLKSSGFSSSLADRVSMAMKPVSNLAAARKASLINPDNLPTKPEPGDAAYEDRIIDLETGKKETPK